MFFFFCQPQPSCPTPMRSHGSSNLVRSSSQYSRRFLSEDRSTKHEFRSNLKSKNRDSLHLSTMSVQSESNRLEIPKSIIRGKFVWVCFLFIHIFVCNEVCDNSPLLKSAPSIYCSWMVSNTKNSQAVVFKLVCIFLWEGNLYIQLDVQERCSHPCEGKRLDLG